MYAPPDPLGDKPVERFALDPARFDALLAEHIKDRRAITDLRVLLEQMAAIPAIYTDRAAWLEDFGNWLHGGSRAFSRGASNDERTSRLRGFILALATFSGFRENFARVVERSGKTGEHYITQTSREWRAMLFSAAGGGFLTTFTAAIKILTTALALPIFFASAAACVNYAGSFLLMGAVGFTLATKQPSMTAAALAAALESQRDRAEGKGLAPSVERLVTLIAQISRSQLAAAVGNIAMVIPAAIAFDFLWRRVSGHPFVGAEKATHVIESLHPLRSGTIVYAAVTGVLLWLSSLGAGWLENWIAYRRLPEALAQHRRLRRLIGSERAERFGKAVGAGAASVAAALANETGAKKVVCVISGGNIDTKKLATILAGEIP